MHSVSEQNLATQGQSNKMVIGGGLGNILEAKSRVSLLSAQVAVVKPSGVWTR